ncbi:MAG: hypothetical protein KA474_05140 [Acinetobacter sp.]|nr:hypothetical protein [Acinetobacter sp.]
MIPYQIRATLLQMEPSLDANWEELLANIFEGADIDVREEIDRQILKPKEIQWNRVTNSFDYRVTNSLAILKHSFSSERMRSIATKLSHSINWLKSITDPIQIADYLENALHQIDQIPVEDDLKLQREKMMMRRVYLQDVAKLIRTLEIDPPGGVRGLTPNQIKSFIVEVYIKQQLLGYWFKPLLARSSAMMDHPFFKFWLLKEQSVRRFDIVKTSEYLFIIAPVSNFENNPYSIRRFLFEDFLDYNEQIFLNGIVLDMSRYTEKGYIDEFTKQVQMMITVQHQVHKDVILIVQEFEELAEKKLIPMLTQTIGTGGGKNSDVVAKQHIRKFESILTNDFLIPLHDALRNHISHLEEYQYLFVSIHRIFSDILAHYKDFKEQPALFFNHTIELFEYQLLAYVKLLEKRKEEIFVPMNIYEWKVMNDRSEQPILSLQKDLTRHITDYRETTLYIGRLKKEQTEVQGSFMKRMMRGDKLDKELQQVSHSAIRIKKQAYLDILSIPKNFRKYSVFIEFESFTATSELERHYAFPSGDNGVTRLPLLVKIPENLEHFNLEELNNSIS